MSAKKITMKELIDNYALKNSYTKSEVQRAINLFRESMQNFVDENKDSDVDVAITITDLGTFTIKHRAKRLGRNPKRPQETIEIPPKKSLTFKESAYIQRHLNK